MLSRERAEYLFLNNNLWIARALLCGIITAIVLEAVFYSQGECADAREARRKYDHQVSNQMCCMAEWMIATVGFTITGIVAFLSVPRIYEVKHLGRARCCCEGCRIDKTIAILIAMESFGLIILSIFQMCWQVEMHAVGAFFFFVPGCVHIGLLLFSIDRIDRKSFLTYVELNPCFLCFVALILRIFTGNYYAEWVLIAAIGGALLVTQIRLLKDENNENDTDIVRPTRNNEIVALPPPSKGEASSPRNAVNMP